MAMSHDGALESRAGTMSKPRRKVLVMQVPNEVAEAVLLIAKRAGTSRTNVINVLLAAAMLRLERVALVPDPVRRAPTR
jgi:hypothetical protein